MHHMASAFIVVLSDTIVRGFCFRSAKGALVCRVNGELWELGRPLEGDCELKFLGFDTVEGRQVITHSFVLVLFSVSFWCASHLGILFILFF